MALNITPIKTAKPSAKNIIKKSKYQNAEIALKLISEICLVRENDKKFDYSEINNILCEGFEYDNERLISVREHLLIDGDYYGDKFALIIGKLRSFLFLLEQNEYKDYTKVVVAGGFSSGKSSMINKMTSIGSLLPTGTEPVSVIPTYIYCNKSEGTKVMGENLKGNLVPLEKDVLECIQHSSETKVYIASVLEKIYIETYSPKFDGIVFIDTPGYNNSSSTNGINGQTDRETAQKEIVQGDILFWMIDIEAGTIKTDDKLLLETFQGPKVILFTKADKKRTEITNILNGAAKLINIDGRADIIDIVAISSVDESVYQSYKGYSFETLLAKVSAEKQGSTIIEELNELFDQEIARIEEENEKIKKDIQEAIVQKQEANEVLIDIDGNNKKYYQNLREELESIFFKTHDNMDQGIERLSTILEQYADIAWNAVGREKKSFWGDNVEEEIKQLERLNAMYQNVWKIDFNRYEKSYRKQLVENIKESIDYEEKNIIEYWQKEYDFWDEAHKNLLEAKRDKEYNIKLYQAQKKALNKAIEKLISQKQEIESRAKKAFAQEYHSSNMNVYDAIRTDNEKEFYKCISHGVDMSISNADGYTPLTLAVACGNNKFVKFFVKNGANLSQRDEKGNTAFETAVIQHFKDICDILLDTDEDLGYDTQRVLELSKEHKDDFSHWLKGKLK